MVGDVTDRKSESVNRQACGVASLLLVSMSCRTDFMKDSSGIQNTPNPINVLAQVRVVNQIVGRQVHLVGQ